MFLKSHIAVLICEKIRANRPHTAGVNQVGYLPEAPKWCRCEKPPAKDYAIFTIGTDVVWRCVRCGDWKPVRPGAQANIAMLLAHAAVYFKDDKDYAARLVGTARRVFEQMETNPFFDWVYGANPMLMSYIEGVGHNQRQRPVFGQFFPSTPQIPGAMIHAATGEYGMPAVAMVLWATHRLQGHHYNSFGRTEKQCFLKL